MRVIKNILKVVSSNLTGILAGVVVGFLLPKIISVSDYGYYKTFTLYYNYLGILSLGIIDGIVLQNGEKDYGELSREKMRSYFSWYLLLHLIMTAAILVFVFIFEGFDYKFLVFLLAMNLIPANGCGYFQQISQITQRFKEYSVRKILHSVANIMLVLMLVLIYKIGQTNISYVPYLLGLFVINLALFIWYIVTYRDIVFGKREGLGSSFRSVFKLAVLGFPLLLANLCSTLLLSLDRQFVQILFSTEEYATYAFAYSILSLITVATSAVSLVIYPLFKRMDEEVIKSQCSNLNAILLVCMFITMLVYYPLVYFINWFLPQYVYSLSIFRIILPGLVISASITVVFHNYYKVLGKSTDFFVKSVVALIVSFAFNLGAYLIFKTREAISIASIFALMIWYLYTQHGLRKTCKIRYKDIGYILIMCAAFYLSSYNLEAWLGGIIYITVFAVVSTLFYYGNVREIKELIKPSKKADKGE